MPKGVYIRTEYHKKKISESHKNHATSEETKRKISVALIGNKNSQNVLFKKGHAVNWRGGQTIDGAGYVRIKNKGEKKYKLEHHTVVESYIGRKLKGKEMIHHINFNRTDNRLENLYLFRCKSDHMRYHEFLKRNNLNGTNNQLTSNLFIYV